MKKTIKCFVSISTIFTVVFSPLVALTPAVLAADTGFNSPSAQVSDTGGDSNGFELNPTNAFSDGGGYASNMNGAGDRHRFYNYDFDLPSGAIINGIEVRLDWWLDNNTGSNSMDVQLSWNGGTSWTSLPRTNNAESTYDTNNKILGSPTDTWGRTWSASDFNNSNFRVRVTSNSTKSERDFYLDWVAVKVYYTEPVQPAPNPVLGQSCGLDIALVIDSSGSINNSELTQMKNAFGAFVDAFLPETPTQFSVTDFDDTATVLQSFTSNVSLINTAINAPTSGGYTNWEQGLLEAQGTFDPRSNPNLVIFASDGAPNRIGNSVQQVSGSEALEAAIVVANGLKSSGTRIIALGIGDALNVASLEKISSADAVYTSNFATLAEDLAELASQLCGGTITARKIIDADGDLQTPGDQVPGEGWSFDVAGSQEVTDQSGYTSAVKVDQETYSVSETLETGYSLINASCTGATNNGTLSGTTISGIEVGNQDIVSCIFYNAINASCGDGIVNQTSEECDGQEGLPNEHYTCTSQCTLEYIPYCGDGIQNGDEECDGTTGVPPHYTCTSQCTLEYIPYCGDGIQNGDEECDGNSPETCQAEGGYEGMRTCSVDCTWSNCIPQEFCGDGIINDDEECDGSVPEHYTCTSQCTLEYIPYCGDATCDAEENCSICAQDCGSCPPVTINAYKVVCLTEADLPNWGNGGPNITQTTAQDFVNGNQNCQLASGWNFEWAYAGTPNPGNNIIGPAGSGWTTFGPTDSNGLAVTNINSLSGDRLWLREVMKEGYIPFSGDTTAPRDNISAELYCHQDVLNYDNYDYILNPQLDNTYYCVAFNAPVETPQPYCGDSIVNQTSEQCDDGNNVDGDGCSAICQTEQAEPYCGDEVVNQTSEQCDDGNTTSGDGCSATCQNEIIVCAGCYGPTPYCGDGVKNGSEECDDGNIVSGDGCSADCKTEGGLVAGTSTCNLDLDVMIVMDVSGSMGEDSPTRLFLSQTAANSFIANLRSSDQSGLVSFNRTATLNKTLSNDHASTQSIISGLTTGGSTNIGDAVYKANQELMSVPNDLQLAKVEILLTDGRANRPNGDGFNENPADVALALAKSLEAAENGIMIYTIGLGSDVNTGMLQTIADNTGGKYYFSPTSNDLNGIFSQIAAETCRTAFPTYVSPAITIFNERAGAISDTGATVTWYTNIPATSRVVYGNQQMLVFGEAPNYGYAFSTLEQDSVSKVIPHSVTISDLIPNTTYYVRCVSQTAKSTELTFTTLGVGGVIPTIPTPEEGEVAGAETETEALPEGEVTTPEVAGGEETFVTEGAEAAVGGFVAGTTLCWILFIVTILLSLWYLWQKRKGTENRNGRWTLPVIIVVLLILYYFLCCAGCVTFWVLVAINAILFALSFFLKKKQAL